jgi:EmrB/QacA subfamily drug resistance transporter
MTIELQIRNNAVNPLFVLLIASVGCGMTVLDTNIVSVILPTIARDLGASFADIEWVISSYVLCFASLLLPAGAVADRFGRKRVFLSGIILFGLASLLCGEAWSAPALYLARAIQGAGAAFLLAPALSIIGHTFHEEAERKRAWSIWGAMMGLTMVVAPIIGGMIAMWLGWRWAFSINVPIGAVLAGAVILFVRESVDADARALDPAGILSFAATMFGFTLGLIDGQAYGWVSPHALLGFGVGLCGLACFLIVESMQRRPMFDLGLLRNRRFVGAVLAMFSYAACAQVMTSLLPLFRQNGMGRTALQAGSEMMPFALAMLLFPYVGRRLSSRWRSHQILAVGLVVVAVGDVLTGWGASQRLWPLIILGMGVLGSGGGLLNGETQNGIMRTIPHNRAGMASGISTSSRFAGILLGFAVLSGVLATLARNLIGQLSCEGGLCDNVHRFADAVVSGDLSSALDNISIGSRPAALELAHHAYASGFSGAMLLAAVIAALSALLVGVLMRE